MKKIIRKIWGNKIILILLLAFLLNICGIFYAYPLLHLVGDETAIMGAALKMINNFSLRPVFTEYYYLAPAVYVYLPFYLIYFAAFFILGRVRNIAELRRLIILDYACFKMLLPLARFISVLAGCLSVYLVYKISKTLFKDSEGISLWAAFFTATSLLLVQLSHFSRIWIIQVLAIILGFYYLSLVLIKRKSNLSSYLIMGFLIALSFGINAVGGVLYLCFLFIHYQLNKGKKFINIFIKNKKFWFTNLVIFLSVSFIYFLHPAAFYRYFGYFAKKIFISQYASQSVWSSLLGSVGFISHLKVLLEYEPLLMLLFIISLIILFIKERKIFYFLGLFILPYYLIPGPLLRWNDPRYISPVIPFLAIVSAYGLCYFTQRISSNGIKRTLLIIISVLFLFMPVYWNIALLKPNTYVLTKQWIENNLDSGEGIINYGLSNILNENKQTIINISKYVPEIMSARRNYLLNIDEKNYPQPNYHIVYTPERMPQDFWVKNKFNYLIIHWWTNEERENLKKKIVQLNYGLELVQQFYPNESFIDLTDLANNMRRPLQLLTNIKYTGPYIEIYKISKL